MLLPVKFFRKIRSTIQHLQDCYNHYLFQLRQGLIYPWISLGDYQKLKGAYYIGGSRQADQVCCSFFFSLSHPYTTKEVDELFIKEIVRLHGFPASIVSDKDRLFMSLFWKELFKTAGTQLKLSSAYHPQTDGQTEVANRCLEFYLRCLTGTKPKQWPNHLAWAEF